MDNKVWNGSEEAGDVRSEFGEDDGTNCAGGDSDTNCDIVCIKCMKLIVKYFCLAEVLFLWFSLDLDQYIFLWGCQIRVAWRLGKFSNYTVPSSRH